MSIDTELARLTNAKAAIKAAIEGKGVTVPGGTLLDGMAALIEAIEAGGGGDDAAALDSLIDRSITEISNGRVTKIGDFAFDGCRKLTTADFPVATSIGSSAFYQCSKLTTADFPVATSIGSSAFRQCSNLNTADFPVATSIGSSAFDSCSKLTTANFPVAASIGNYAFDSCSKLTTANFPVAKSISMRAFYQCSNLTTADFPVAASIGNYAFWKCNLTALILRKTDAVCTLSSTNAFDSTPIASGTGHIYVPFALVDSYKAATNWSTYANQIRAIEDYPEITGGAA